MSLLAKFRKSSPTMKVILTCAVAGVLTVIATSFMNSPDSTAPPSKIPSVRADISGGAGGASSDEYDRKLKEHDEQKAKAALTGGDSYVSSLSNTRKSILGKNPAAPSPAPVAPAVQPVPVRAGRTEDPVQKRMMEELAELDNRIASTSSVGKIVFLKEVPEKKKKESKAVSAPTPSKKETLDAVKPGDLLYAVIDTGVNSDVPSPVLATVTSGTYRNARLTGGFQRHDEKLVLSFSRMILPDGKAIQLEAYAVDPTTSEASVASSVNTHFFSRWGGLVASAFLEGLGTAKRYSGAQSTLYGYGEDSDHMVWDDYSISDQSWIAAGKVGEKAGKIFERQFDRPPTVKLKSGTPVGVLILNIKR